MTAIPSSSSSSSLGKTVYYTDEREKRARDGAYRGEHFSGWKGAGRLLLFALYVAPGARIDPLAGPRLPPCTPATLYNPPSPPQPPPPPPPTLSCCLHLRRLHRHRCICYRSVSSCSKRRKYGKYKFLGKYFSTFFFVAQVVSLRDLRLFCERLGSC